MMPTFDHNDAEMQKMQKLPNCQKKYKKAKKKFQEGKKAKHANTIKHAKVTSKISHESDAAFWN